MTSPLGEVTPYAYDSDGNLGLSAGWDQFGEGARVVPSSWRATSKGSTYGRWGSTLVSALPWVERTMANRADAAQVKRTGALPPRYMPPCWTGLALTARPIPVSHLGLISPSRWPVGTLGTTANRSV